MKLDLQTIEGQFKAGLFCAKNAYSKSKKIQSKIQALETRALISRLYLDDCKTLNPLENELTAAWYEGIYKGLMNKDN